MKEFLGTSLALRQKFKFFTFALLAASLMACSGQRLVNKEKIETHTLAVKVKNFCPSNISGNQYSLVDFFAVNKSAVMNAKGFQLDSDRDGLTDDWETEFGSQYLVDPKRDDSDGDGYSDSVAVRVGSINTGQTFKPCNDSVSDVDHDGIPDCEEDLLFLDKNNPDTDADGIPDGLEVRFGSNPSDKTDSYSDGDGDGISNLDEIRYNSPVASYNEGFIPDLQISYKLYMDKDTTPGCTNVIVSNIPIVQVTNGNMIELSFLERSVSGGRNLRFVRLIVPRNFESGARIVVSDVSNQTINPNSTPFIKEPN